MQEDWRELGGMRVHRRRSCGLLFGRGRRSDEQLGHQMLV